MENEEQRLTTLKLPNETEIEYRFFQQFLELGSIANVFKSHNCQIGERSLNYLAQQKHWKERKKHHSHEQKIEIFAERVEIIVNLKARQINNIISSANTLENIMEGVLACVPNTMEDIFRKVSTEPTKILQYAINMNNLFKMYATNQDRLNKKLEEVGLDFKDLNPTLDDINFGNEYDKVLSEIEEDEKSNFNEDFENLVKGIYPHLFVDIDLLKTQAKTILAKTTQPKLNIKEKNYGIPTHEPNWNYTK